MKKIEREPILKLILTKASESKLVRELRRQGFVRVSSTTSTTTTTP